MCFITQVLLVILNTTLNKITLNLTVITKICLKLAIFKYLPPLKIGVSILIFHFFRKTLDCWLRLNKNVRCLQDISEHLLNKYGVLLLFIVLLFYVHILLQLKIWYKTKTNTKELNFHWYIYIYPHVKQKLWQTLGTNGCSHCLWILHDWVYQITGTQWSCQCTSF